MERESPTLSFQNTVTGSTELSDFHKMINRVSKMNYKKNPL